MNAGILVGVMVVVIVLLFFALIRFARKKTISFPEVKESITLTANRNDALRNYYCKSSYNTCAVGDFTNSWVDLKAVDHALQRGCRFLDFEIYDIGGVPSVAVSNTAQYAIKGSFNSLPLNKVFARLKVAAFNVPMPLFLQLRIKCEHANVINKIAKLLQDYFGDKLMGNEYSYEARGQNFGEMKLADLERRVVVVADMSNKTIGRSALKEYVNIGAGGAFNRIMRFHELKQGPPTDLDLFAKQKLVTCLPDLTSGANNYDSKVAFDAGVQFAAMCFQTQDSHLKDYLKKFDGYSFILKPENLRYYPTKVPSAPALPSSQNYSNVINTVRAGGQLATVTLPGNSA